MSQVDHASGYAIPMKPRMETIHVQLDGLHTRLWSEWARAVDYGYKATNLGNGIKMGQPLRPTSAMVAHATAYGSAGALKDDDSYLLIQVGNDGRVRRRTYPIARLARG